MSVTAAHGSNIRAHITVRPAMEQDAGHLITLLRELAEETDLLDEFEMTEELLRQHAFGKRPAIEFLCGYIDEELAGFAAFFHNYSTFHGKLCLYLEDIYVTPDKRRQGLGTRLIVEVLRISVERGCPRVEGIVHHHNDKAKRFYKNLGARSLKQWTLYRVNQKEVLEYLARHGYSAGSTTEPG